MNKSFVAGVIAGALIFSLSVPVCHAAVEVIYSDGFTFDLHYIGRCTTDRKCELIRHAKEETVIKTWSDVSQQEHDNGYYFSDIYGPYEYISYSVNVYRQTATGWELLSIEDEVDVQTDRIQGTLHNSKEWLAKLDRFAVSFEGVMKNPIDQLVVEDGDLILEPGTLFTIDGNMTVISPARLLVSEDHSADEFLVTVEGEGTLEFHDYADVVKPLLRQFFFPDRVNVILENCKNVALVSNQLGPDEPDNRFNSIYIYNNSSKIFLNGNKAGGIGINADDSEIINNDTGVMEINGDRNLVENNSTGSITLYGQENTIRENTIVMKPRFYNGSISQQTGRGIYIAGDDMTMENTVEKNTITCKYTSRHNQEAMLIDARNNTIQNNVIGEAGNTDYYGGGILITGVGNTVKDNSILDVYYWGIKLQYEADMNILENNTIDGIPIGIFIQEGNDNMIYLNQISNARTGIELDLEDYEYSNGINRNHIYKNHITSCEYTGIAMSQEGIEYTHIYDNIIENNMGAGISIPFANLNNLIYGNRFVMNSGGNAQDNGNDNQWYHQEKGGNFWDDYTGSDLNKDGFGDTPYDIAGTAGARDEKPLMEPQGDIQITPAQLDFGFVIIDGDAPVISPEKPLEIKNIGAEPLSILGALIGGKDQLQFKVKTNPCSGNDIPASGSCQIVVSYSPFESGTHQAQLSIISDDTGDDVVKINLTGNSAPLVKGDINQNGGVDVLDALELLKIPARKISDSATLSTGDMDNNGKLDLIDAQILIQKSSDKR